MILLSWLVELPVLEKKMKKIVGEVNIDLECRFSKIRTEETNVGNWICDIVLDLDNEQKIEEIKNKALSLCKEFPVYK